MNYTILTPDNIPVSVTLVREVRYGGQLLGQPYQTTVTNTNGTFSDSVDYSLPNNASLRELYRHQPGDQQLRQRPAGGVFQRPVRSWPSRRGGR